LRGAVACCFEAIEVVLEFKIVKIDFNLFTPSQDSYNSWSLAGVEEREQVVRKTEAGVVAERL
jgi:hypothetical protein